MKILQRITLALVIIGAINWGLIGFFSFDLVATIFGGQDAVLSRIVSALVGLSGLVCLSLLFSPWDEMESSAETRTGSKQHNLNYGTEFGEEADFSSVKKPAKKDPL